MTRALVLCGDGINCEQETAYALSLAGADSEICHINDLIRTPERLRDYRILALPGGFSFGDEVSSGKILALKLQYALGDVLRDFIEQDNLVVGICNGFQALVKLGILPESARMAQQVTLTRNRQKRFINRWVRLNTGSASLFFDGLESMMLPIRHGEGRLMVPPGQESDMVGRLKPHAVLQYQEDINGSFERIAALVNERGNVMGMMPHPEAFVRWTQHPAWTSLPESERETEPAGLRIFKNMVQAVRVG